MRRFLIGTLSLVALAAIAQITSTRIGQYEWTCQRDGAVISGHTRQDKAQERCTNLALADPGTEYQIWPSGYRIIADANAQFSSVTAPTFSGVTAGNAMGIVENDQDSPAHYLYEDGGTVYDLDTCPSAFIGLPLLHTLATDETTTGDTTVVSVTVDNTYVRPVVFHDREIVTKPDWLANNYSAIGCSITSGGTITYDAYLRDIFVTGAINFGGNCPTGGCSGAMYVVAMGTTYNSVQAANEPPTPNNGLYHFLGATVTVAESAGARTDLLNLERYDGSDGAVSVDIADAGTGTCTSGVEYTWGGTATQSWASGDLSVKQPSITINAAAADCTAIFDFENAMGGIATGDIVTKTITIEDAPAAGAGVELAGLSFEDLADELIIDKACTEYGFEEGEAAAKWRGHYHNGANCSTTSPNAPSVVSAVSGRVYAGTRAIKFIVADNNNNAVTSNYRSSITYLAPTAGRGTTGWAAGGVEHWVGWAVNMDTAPSVGATSFQFHNYDWVAGNCGSAGPSCSPTWNVRAETDGQWRIEWRSNRHNGGVDEPPNADLGAWALDTWHTFVGHFIYDDEAANGVAQVWLNGTLVYDETGITFPPDDVEFGYYVPGAYAASCKTNVCTDWIVYMDEIRVDDSTGNFASVDPDSYN